MDFLDPEIQDDAISQADRLNVIPLYNPPETPVALYALTPGTSFPGKKRRLHAGRKEERAFLTALLGRAHPYLVWKLPTGTMQGNVKLDWEGLVQRQRGAAARLEDKFISSFRKALDIEFEVPFSANIQKILEKNTRGRFVGRLRRALAHTVLLDSPPDLVILDEFQRYSDMLGKENRGDSLIQALFEPKGPRRPALLLLRIRCHVAVPFGSTDDDDRKRSDAMGDQAPRSDELRNAFNSPFWPHVLATTSVGQEGLDFHTWCRRILHWDLCSSPLELEQREGRIQRFGGLAVRIKLRELAEGDLWQPGAIGTHASLWDRIEVLANAKYRDRSGLSPWWVLKGATVSRFVFNLPQSRDIEKFTLLKEQRLIYRLALGQPNQEDLVDFLAKGGPGLTRILQPLALNLSAFARSESPAAL